MTPGAANRLQVRAGLGPDPALGAALQPLPAARAVERLVEAASVRREAGSPPPDWVGEEIALPRRGAKLTDEQRRALVRQTVQRGVELQGWWIGEMLATPAPLVERMTLFWHGHFTSGLREVRLPQLLYRQNVLLRAHALGNYRELLMTIVRDPAMLLYLNNQQNRKDAPNENFARELLELFTLGEGHYAEADIREAARAFTGWKALPPRGEFTVVRRQHDDGVKHFLGASGNLDGDDIVALVLQQPRAAEFIVGKLWREFVTPEPDPAAVRRLAADFRRDWEIAPLVRALLREASGDARAAGALLKSPVEFVVGTLRSLDLPLPPRAAALAAAQMGQTLFAPPNVRGWPGGDAWITTETLLARREFILTLSGERTPATPSADGDSGTAPEAGALRRRVQQGVSRATARLGPLFGERAEAHPPLWGDTLLVLAPVAPAESGATPADHLQAALLDPVYHLK
jgi:uncharacterized protein (DUF1800 family)